MGLKDFLMAYLHYLLFLVKAKQIGHLSRVQDTVHVFEKSLVFDLSIG